MPTTKFVDIKMTETVENYRYEKQDYTFEKGDTVSLPLHTASKFVNKWDYAEYAKRPYEVDREDYDDVVCRIRNDKETCEVEKSDGEVCGREKPCSYHD